jgi:glutamate synthase (ferredoxin)
LERDACGIGFVADGTGRAGREIVERALEGLCRLRHRGAVDADARTGDGAGLLLPIPARFLAGAVGGPEREPGRLGVAMVFGRGDDEDTRSAVAEACAAEGIRVVAWREVPAERAALGARGRSTMPGILQAILVPPDGASARESERLALRARRRVEHIARERGAPLYVASLSFRTITYKALVAADQLAAFYPDLRDPAFEAWFAIFHQRYSTNTAPTWERAQPFRMLCHNGEINTIAGNVHRMRGREGRLGLPNAADEELFSPVVDEAGSDSAMLDESVELLSREGPGGGRDIRHAMAMLVPAAWESDPDLSEEVRAFYRWHESLVEPWDGPAALVFTDGFAVGAALDRNGLRPLRYAACEDGFVACASEAGAVDTSGHGPVRRGKLGPGEMMFLDPRGGGLQRDPVARVARRRPYAAWLRAHRVAGSAGRADASVPDDLLPRQVVHGYTREDLSLALRPAATSGKEPTLSMGDDTPIAPFSDHRRPLANHFKQRFAQVTNPAMDHLRERSVMSLRVLLGPRDPILWERPEAAGLVEYPTFLLLGSPDGERLDATWPASHGPGGLRTAIRRLGKQAVEAARRGAYILVVTDEAAGPDRCPIPSLLAGGAVNAALVRAGIRSRASIVVQADDAHDSHHLACLVAVGAEAVHPRLALQTAASLGGSNGDGEGTAAMVRFAGAMEEGVLKILAKLGISCLDSYRGGQAFDLLGLGAEVVETCFPGTASPIGGSGFERIAMDQLERHAEAFGPAPARLPNPGFVKFHRGGEHHASNPDVVRALHRVVDPGLERLRSTAAGDDGEAVRTNEVRAAHALRGAVAAGEGDRDRAALYRRFSQLVHARPPSAPRDLLDVLPAGPPIPTEGVEPASAILRRFSTGAISHGAISKEAHETLAVAMNRIGGRSNTGEGGEDPARYRTEANSRIKQVASGRFGVTPEYCSFADELQIKIAQGSKPGEGGQLPGHKVTEEIARLRHTQPGVALISPAPHHDIYSIEDLAQLVFDLKQVNPVAEVSVKLVAETGVGTVAAGVAKGLAEIVHVAGADGGTGASPLGSIKNAGLPWEIGLAETQRALVESGLRGRVRLRADGGLKTGRDVLVAALLGADEYSFGTAALLAEGCIMVRTCHLDTCPAGIATQRRDLRAKFAGTPAMVAAYLEAVAEELRELLAGMGLRSVDEAVGRSDLLRLRAVDGRAGDVDLSPLLLPVEGQRRFAAHLALQRPRSSLGDRLYHDAWESVWSGGRAELSYPIGNADRTVGARLGGAIGREFGESAPPGSVRAKFRGSAGQSFGAFLAAGVEFRLIGEANDYVGKGMGGGRVVILPPRDDAGDPHLAGNVVLYGATGGELFVAGRVGERLAVRNSGATAVVEGAGDHACEYMTGGIVVVLGPVGWNLGAGMTGGRAFVLDAADGLAGRVNAELVEVAGPDPEDLGLLRALIERHAELTGSARAHEVLAAWPEAARRFLRVAPREDVVVITQRNEGTPAHAKESVAVTASASN